jgi:hypothetical protein
VEVKNKGTHTNHCIVWVPLSRRQCPAWDGLFSSRLSCVGRPMRLTNLRVLPFILSFLKKMPGQQGTAGQPHKTTKEQQAKENHQETLGSLLHYVSLKEHRTDTPLPHTATTRHSLPSGSKGREKDASQPIPQAHFTKHAVFQASTSQLPHPFSRKGRRLTGCA